MDVADITPENLATLTHQGYTASDLGFLAESEVNSLLMVERADDADLHGDALARQDAAPVEPTPVEPEPAAESVDDPKASAAPAPFIPQYTVEVPADANEKIAAARAKEKESFNRLMDGEIDAEAYQLVKEESDAEIDTLRTKALTATIFQKANEQAAEQAARNDWGRAETSSFNQFKAEGLDYKAAGKESLLAAYNHNLKALGTDPKNENRDAPWFLSEAHRMTKEVLGIATARKDSQGNRSAVDIANLPPTLRNVPVAAMGAVNGDEFAHMRNLDGLALERAHAALNDAQRDRYMNE
jgi:hypothetical protein